MQILVIDRGTKSTFFYINILNVLMKKSTSVLAFAIRNRYFLHFKVIFFEMNENVFVNCSFSYKEYVYIFLQSFKLLKKFLIAERKQLLSVSQDQIKRNVKN